MFEPLNILFGTPLVNIVSLLSIMIMATIEFYI